MRIVDLKIEDVAFGGKGVARENGKAIFIPFTIEGELVSAKITREKKQFAEAEVVDLRERSAHRVERPCPYFGDCGGSGDASIPINPRPVNKTKPPTGSLGGRA